MLLSIYIPTFNRAEILRRQLSSLVGYLSSNTNLSEKIEIVVSDNASTDKTPVVLDRFKSIASSLNFVSHTNDDNIGPSSNFIQSADLCSGDYIWILGDDDIVMIHQLPEVLNTLQDGLLEIMFMLGSSDTLEDQPGYRILSRTQLFCEFDIGSLAHISRLIFRRSVLQAALPMLKSCPSYYVWLMAAPLAELDSQSRIAVSKYAVIYATKDGGMDIWTGKTSLARLAEYYSYCCLAARDTEDLSKIVKVNFSRRLITRKYVAASVRFPYEHEAMVSIEPLLTSFGLQHNPMILLGKLLQSKFMYFGRRVTMRLLDFVGAR